MHMCWATISTAWFYTHRRRPRVDRLGDEEEGKREMAVRTWREKSSQVDISILTACVFKICTCLKKVLLDQNVTKFNEVQGLTHSTVNRTTPSLAKKPVVWDSDCYNFHGKYRSVPQIRPPFCNLSLSTKRRGAYTRDATISLTITPSLPIKHDSLGGGWRPSTRRRRAQSGETLPTLAVG